MISTHREAPLRPYVFALTSICALYGAPSADPSLEAARALIRRGIDTMGGEAKLAGIQGLKLEGVGRTAWVEQSERPEGPFVHSYEQFTEWQDLKGHRLRRESSTRGLQPLAWSPATSLVVTSEGGVVTLGQRPTPARGAQLDEAARALSLNPAKLMLSAASAEDLSTEPDATLFGTPHSVVRFQAGPLLTRLLLNQRTGLPDAVETTQAFRDFWCYWGDVRDRITWGDWELEHGVRTPRLWEESRNGQAWREWTITGVELNPSYPDRAFEADATALETSRKAATSPGMFSFAFSAAKALEPFPGLVIIPGAWYLAFVRTDEGLTLLEAPISESYTQGAMAEAAVRFPGAKLTQVISTSDSWPHHGGVRSAVAAGLPVAILDLNQPLLDRIVSAPWTIHPDALQKARKQAKWRPISSRTILGKGPNRMELIPLRGNTTERQMMVYFPERRLLYASDTIAFQDGQLFNPAQVDEVVRAVAREKLDVETVFAMHAAPMRWSRVLELLGGN